VKVRDKLVLAVVFFCGLRCGSRS